MGWNLQRSKVIQSPRTKYFFRTLGNPQWCSWNKQLRNQSTGRWQVNPELNPGVDLYLQIQEPLKQLFSSGPYWWMARRMLIQNMPNVSMCQVKRRTSNQVLTSWSDAYMKIYENIGCLGWFQQIEPAVRQNVGDPETDYIILHPCQSTRNVKCLSSTIPISCSSVAQLELRGRKTQADGLWAVWPGGKRY